MSRVGLARSAWDLQVGNRFANQDIVCAARNGGLNDNHSIGYCLLGYLCAYYRHYHPVEFMTAFLNDAANDDDILNGTAYATKVGIAITMPKWGISRGDYFYDAEKRIIAKGLSSVKYMGNAIADDLYRLSKCTTYEYFVDLLAAINEQTSLNTRQLDILIKLDFFSQFGNQRELLRITDLFYNVFKCGAAKQIQKTTVDGTPLQDAISKHSRGMTKAGKEAKSYTMEDVPAILRACEDAVKSIGMPDLTDLVKVRNFQDIMGYAGYVTGREEDRPKLCVMDVSGLVRKRDGAQFGYSVYTKSIGSGKEARFTVFNSVFDENPIKKGDIIICKRWSRDGAYFKMNAYEKVV